MKKLLIASLSVMLLFGCKKDEVQPTKTLVGTRWSSFSFKSVVDGSNVYKMLYFKNETEVEWYSADEKSKLVGTKEVLTYTYVHPKITIKRTVAFNNNPPFTREGTVNDTFISVLSADYNKE